MTNPKNHDTIISVGVHWDLLYIKRGDFLFTKAWELKEVQTLKNTKRRKEKPYFCSVKVRFNEEQYEKLKSISEECKAPMSKIIREAVFGKNA